MRKYFQNRFALSEQGAKDLIKGSLLSALFDISLMIPVGIFVMMVGEVMEKIFGPEPSQEISILKYVVLVILALGIIYILSYLQYSSVYISTYGESATRRISLAEKLRKLPLDFFGRRDLSDLTNTIMQDCGNLEKTFSHSIPQFFGAILSTSLIIVGLFAFNWKMALAVLWVIPVAFGMLVLSKRFQVRLEQKHYSTKLECADIIQEGIETIQDIKAYNVKEEYLNDLDRKLDLSEKAQIKSEFIVGTLVSGAQAFLRLGLASTILLGAKLLLQGEIDFMIYLIFLITASRIYEPLSANLQNIAAIFGIEVPIKRMKEIVDMEVQSGSEEYEIYGHDIEFKNVYFSYNKEKFVLNDVSFTAKQGEITALIGPSGGGKSTAAKLAARFWDIDSGRITLGGRDISEIDPESLLEKYSIVFQDVTLFNDTVMENIRLGRRGASDDEVVKAAKIARCDGFIRKMKDGYNTIIGENGSTLSGGERQRISIARALLKDAPIILLDEATASLDVENETEIQKAISELIRDKTVLVIAHRMRTIANADKIVVLEAGKVNQQDKPRKLFEKGGIYRRMVELQNESLGWSL